MTRSLPSSVITWALLIAWVEFSIAQQTPADRLFDQAIAAFHAENYSSAAELFERVETVSPGSTDALLLKGKCLIHTQDFSGAEQALRRYLRLQHDSATALYLLGFVLHRENKPAESLETYTRAAAITKPAGDDLKIVGLNYVLLNDYPDAIHWLEKAVELDPNNKEAWYYLGRAYYTEARLPEARKAFLTVLKLNPQDARAENNLGLISETNGQFADALEAYKKAITWQEKNPTPSEQPYVNLGSLLLQQGDIQGALPMLEHAAALAPSDSFCRMKLGIAYRQVGRLPDAQLELEKATQLQPDNPTAHYQLGRVYKEMHALDRAQAEFGRTAELQSKAARATSSSSQR